jgi:hypothetical protein
VITLDQIIFVGVLTGLFGMIYFLQALVRRAHELLAGVHHPAVKDYIVAYVVALKLDSPDAEPRGWHF